MLEQNFIDYYQGAYKPTLRINFNSRRYLIKFKEIITAIKDGTIETFSFSSFEGITILGIKDLILRKQSKKLLIPERITMICNSNSEKPVFIWCLNSEEWWHCEGLIEGLIESNEIGHQYLFDEELLIELYLATV
ncbi:MAG TPA: hypothetical protein PLZ08_12095 [Bacillota bacterium]|jgi:hypothetical protein|nr:hypothetical protein [Bacillota bacterium]HOL10837.1 hypothetical protein [Bacillota bacterium]HPO98679.1 hypothetical protein [Bacillota bacterium]